MHVAARCQSVALCLLSVCSALATPGRLTAQTPQSSAVVMVEIQCKPGTADKWLEEFETNEVPAIREAIKKGDTYSGFTYFEAPLVAQDVDFVLVFEAKSFASLDVRRIPPHIELLLQHLGPERFEALQKQTGEWEQKVTVRILRAYKVQ
jgi:hypothetical protein